MMGVFFNEYYSYNFDVLSYHTKLICTNSVKNIIKKNIYMSCNWESVKNYSVTIKQAGINPVIYLVELGRLKRFWVSLVRKYYIQLNGYVLEISCESVLLEKI